MTIDVAAFERLNVSDTCAVWNVLSSMLLQTAAIGAKIQFCTTDYVRYECLDKPRAKSSKSDDLLRARLVAAQASGRFTSFSISVEDLQELRVLETRQRLGKGELSSIVFALRTRQAFHTDDTGARKLGRKMLSERLVQTTPHLLGHLVFENRLSDRQSLEVIEEHRKLGRPLAQPLQDMYEEGLRCRLMMSQCRTNPLDNAGSG